MSGHYASDPGFGAQALADGVRFRLWAPGQGAVRLLLTASGRALDMAPAGGGWFELTTAEAAPGSEYQYVLESGLAVPDPASRAQAEDVHGPSVVVDPAAYAWSQTDWAGRPWAETVLYELHTGTFSDSGDFAGVERELDRLAELGVTAVELLPVADFPGRWNWGYDGVLLYAPDRAYGAPEDLKRLVDAAHARGMMAFMDVVYNHFGPDGNYLHAYAPDFFTEAHHTPWGAAIDFSKQPVRDFFIGNARYWLEEYRFDGLRFDAVHAIVPEFRDRFLIELAERLAPLRRERHIHLVLENGANEAHFLGEGMYDAQWNDDIHHAFHVVGTGESDGYYADYAQAPLADLGRALAEGFVFQGEASDFHDGARRGEPSAHLPPTAFVSFLQNHDQVGNRAMGERLPSLVSADALEALTTVHLLAPQIPMLFMGEEDAAETPFYFFCDFHDELAEAVRKGRRQEFAKFPAFADARARERIPDPNAEATFEACRLKPPADTAHRARVRALLAARREHVTPLVARGGPVHAGYTLWGAHGLSVQWTFGDDRLRLTANLGDAAATPPPEAGEVGEVIAAWPEDLRSGAEMPPWSAVWTLAKGTG